MKIYQPCLPTAEKRFVQARYFSGVGKAFSYCTKAYWYLLVALYPKITTFVMMKTRFWLHLAFWLAYLGWEIYVEYLWTLSMLEKYSFWAKLWKDVLVELSVLPPKMLLCYAFAWYMPKFQARHGIWLGVYGLGMVLLHRALSNYLAYPLAYGEAIGVAFWNPRLLSSSVLDCLLVLGVFGVIQLLRRQARQQLYAYALRKEKLEAELLFLRNQINPHFLFNILNGIYALARKKSDQTAEVVLKLSQLLRFMLYECRQGQISLMQEVKVIQDYIALEKVRYQDRVQVVFEPMIDEVDTPIAPLILLPFVENAFKHGVGESRFQAFIHIDLQVIKNNLYFKIVNSKEETTQALQENIGLQNIKRQLELTYQDFDLKIEPQTHQFVVELHIQLQKNVVL